MHKALNLGVRGRAPGSIAFVDWQWIDTSLEILVVFTGRKFAQIPLTAVVVVVV